MTLRNRLLRPLTPMLEALFPFPCLGCDAPLGWGRQLLGLCARCRGKLPRQPSGCCRGCGRHLPARSCEICGECLRHPPPWDRLVTLYRYEPPLPHVIHALKFRRLEFLARDLGEVLAKSLPPEIGERCDVVTPIPLSWLRLLRRGFNQAALVAEPLAERLGLPVRSLLRRKPRSPQARLSRGDRLRNLEGSFVCDRLVQDHRVLLVDDIVTTGATLTAGARCLRRAGARIPLVAVAARTPRRFRGQ